MAPSVSARLAKHIVVASGPDRTTRASCHPNGDLLVAEGPG